MKIDIETLKKILPDILGYSDYIIYFSNDDELNKIKKLFQFNKDYFNVLNTYPGIIGFYVSKNFKIIGWTRTTNNFKTSKIVNINKLYLNYKLFKLYENK